MNNETYLIPANTKSGALFLSIFNGFDLIMFGTGIGITIILLMILPIDQASMAVIALSPALVTAFLVVPIPNYHNIFTVIVSALNFLTERRIFIWKGWCVYGKENEK